MIRRLPALLLSVALAAVALAALSGLVTAQETPPDLYTVPVFLYGGAEYGNADNISCSTGPGVECSFTLNHWVYQRNAGMEDVTGTIPYGHYTGTGHTFYGAYMDYVISRTGGSSAMSYFAGTDWLGIPDGGASGRVCLELSGRPTGLIRDQIFNGVGCTAFASGGGANGPLTLDKLIGPSNYWAQGIGDQAPVMFAFYNINLITSTPVDEDGNPTQPPDTHPGGGGASCVFTITITATNGLSETGGITDTGGITPTEPITNPEPITATVVYSRNANLVTNNSFERGSGGAPLDWDQVDGGAFRSYDWSDWWIGGAAGRTGGRYMKSGYPFDLYQDVSLQGGEASYVAGYFARCIADGCNEAFNLYWSPLIMPGITPPILAHGDVNTTDYTEYTGTKKAAAGVAVIMVRPLGNGAYLDDIFVYPIDPDSGALLCDPTLYPNPTTGELPPGDWELPPGLEPVPMPGEITDPPGTPGPITGAGATCYSCNTPRDFSQGAVSYWIAWLGCVVRNMFACSLRVWLMYVANSVYGVFQILHAFLVWVPAQAQGAATWAGGLAQQAVNWVASDVVPGLAVSVSVTTEAGTNFWDVLIALIQLINGLITGLLSLLGALVGVIADLVMALGGLLLGIAKLLVAFVGSLHQALTTDPVQLDLLGDSNPHPAGADLAAAGVNDSKILFVFLATLTLIDQAVVGEYGAFLLVALGAIGFGVMIWTLNHWRDFLSF